jgi:hypothetical protein
LDDAPISVQIGGAWVMTEKSVKKIREKPSRGTAVKPAPVKTASRLTQQ